MKTVFVKTPETSDSIQISEASLWNAPGVFLIERVRSDQTDPSPLFLCTIQDDLLGAFKEFIAQKMQNVRVEEGIRL